MTKLALMSDLHIDLNHFSDIEIQTLKQVLNDEGIDHLHLAGDISNNFKDISRPFLADLGKEVNLSFNLGNHDMLNLSEDDIRRLDFQRIDLTPQTSLLSFHGWYDYSFSNQSLEKITQLKKAFWFDRRLNRLKDDPQICQDSQDQLEHHLQELKEKRVIVAMHFVPHSNFTMTHPRFTPFNAFLGSQSFHHLFRQYGVKDVIFGHAHRSYGDVAIDGVSYHSRPLGYIREWDLTIDFVNQNPRYNPSGSWNLSKRYNAVRQLPDFQSHKQEKLADEFRQSMTVFDL